ncbi:MAG: Gfo/Idh/MocA family oxidoreductase [Proteiniphilum sp.]|jgi:predicted dehydrogenase|nr:Gfo/Idh/MocA family oxidoreductase [Proteiniphilum sp.]
MNLSRRSFLKRSSCAAVAGLSIPAYLRAATPGASANDRISVALIGCRSMGWANLTDFLPHSDVQCVALCDIDRSVLDSRAKELSGIQSGKFSLYADYRHVLDRRDVDAVIIGTPDHWHCLQFVDACRAGKHVYVEKPAANSVAECDAMTAAAAKYGRVVQVGQQQRSARLWKDMVDYLHSGVLGKIGRVHVWANFNYAAIPHPVPDSAVPEGVDFQTWLGPAPDRTFNSNRFHGSWRMFWDYGGGLMTDWGVHLLDMVLWGMDIKSMPVGIQACAGNFLFPEGAHETFDTQSVQYLFDDFIFSWENNAGIESGPYGRCYGIAFTGTNGTLVANRDNWVVYPERDTIPAKTAEADHREHRDHVTNFLDCVKNGDRNTACPIETGSLSAKYAHLGNIAARMNGVTLRYDDAGKTFNLPDADRFLKPAYRKPWIFPEV